MSDIGQLGEAFAERLSLGTAQVAAGYGATRAATSALTADDLADLLATARSLGIRHLDTAPDYGDAELMLGSCGLDGWEVSTKIKAPQDGERDVRGWVAHEIEGSMARLGVDRLDTVLLHRPEVLATAEGTVLLDALAKMRSAGTIRAVGASVYGPEDLGSLLLTEAIDVIQAPVSVVDRRMLHPDVTQLLHDHGSSLHARSVFLQGLLLVEPSARPGWARRSDVALAPWDDWSVGQSIGRGALLLSYVLGRQEVDRIVIGVESSAQLDELVRDLGGPVPPVPDAVVVDEPEVLDPRRWPVGRG
jgi:aryl-alcohol dehydrogenase-like predicted oxidoreductase